MIARRPARRFGALFLSLALPACVVGPAYESPGEPPAGRWTLESAAVGDPAQAGVAWQVFDDERLEQLIDAARAGNPGLRRAAARLAESRAIRAGVAGGRWPVADARGGVTRRRLSENGALPAGQVPGLDVYQTIFDLGFDAAWELDLFGRTRSAVAAADADVDATAADLADLRLTVSAEVARNYLELQSARAALDALGRARDAARELLRLTAARADAGEVTPADESRAAAELAALEARLPGLESAVRLRALALAALLGEPPGSRLGLLSEPVTLAALATFPAGERADVLRRRADVRAAERRLAAASFGVNSATAEWFPRLAINAAGGFESLETGTLFDAASQDWSVAPLFRWRIFDAGRVRAGVDASEARAEQAAITYEETVLRALVEAEQSLARYHYALISLSRQREAQEAMRTVYRQLESRERAGEISPLELLAARVELAESEQATALAHGEAATSLVALIKSLGGGWSDMLAI